MENVYDFIKEPYLINEPETGEKCYRLWRDRIESALRWREKVHWNGDMLWRKLLDIYKGSDKALKYLDAAFLQDQKQARRMFVQKISSDINTLASFLMQRKMQFTADPNLPENLVSAKIQAAWLNYEWRFGDMDVQRQKCIYDFLKIGHCVAFVGFERPEDNPAKKGYKRISYCDFIRPGHSYLYRVSPFNFIYDYDCPTGNIDSARWCAEFFRIEPQDVFNNAAYDQAVLRKIRQNLPDYMPHSEEFAYRRGENQEIERGRDKKCDKWVGCKLWDKKYSKYYVFIMGVLEPIREEIWPYDYLDSFPYRKADCIPIDDDEQPEPYGLSLIVWMLDQQVQLNRERTRQSAAANAIVPKWLVREGAVEPSEMEKLCYTDAAEFHIVKDPNGVTVMPQPELTRDQYNFESSIRADMDQISGVTALMSNAPLPGRTSASEVSLRANYGNIKLADKAQSIDKFTLEIGRLLLQHFKGNPQGEQIIKIAGPEGTYMPQKFSFEDIQSEADLDLEVYDAPDMSPPVKQRMAIEFGNFALQVAQMFGQAGQSVNLTEIVRIIGEAYNRKDLSRIFPDMAIIPLPPQTQTAQQQQAQPGGNPNQEEVFRQGAMGGQGMSEAMGAAMGGANNIPQQ